MSTTEVQIELRPLESRYWDQVVFACDQLEYIVNESPERIYAEGDRNLRERTKELVDFRMKSVFPRTWTAENAEAQVIDALENAFAEVPAELRKTVTRLVAENLAFVWPS